MKKIFAVLLAVVTACSLVSCNGRKYAELQISNISGFGHNIINKTDFEDELADDSDLKHAAKLLSIELDLINTTDGELEIFRSAAAMPPEEITIIGARDAESAKNIVNRAFTDRVRRLHSDFSDLDPEQLPKIKSSVKMAAGRYAFLIISNDNSAAKKALNDLLNTAIRIHE